MKLFTIIFERLPMVWFLLGLLFNAAGLYLGFEYTLSFVYLIVGWLCCAYGLAIFALRFLEKPKSKVSTGLSPKFISAGTPSAMPSIQGANDEQAAEQPDSAEQSTTP